ncbi:MAG: phosphotransferase family protein [Sandaracinaceae bacterium]|nr:phosphotransferase family protein [Sandaracinaceae bacterium]
MVGEVQQEALGAAVAMLCRDALGPDTEVVEVKRLTAGASATTHRVRVRVGASGTERALILRRAAPGDPFGGRVGPALEAATQAAVFAAGGPVAEVVAAFEAHSVLGDGYLMGCLEGETLGPRIVRDPAFGAARAALVGQCAQALACIHDVSPGDLPSLPVRGAETQLDELMRLHRSFGERAPVLEAAFRVLRDDRPETSEGPCLVHGDFRVGNLVVGPAGLVGVLDWELTHLGDPVEDLGWLCVAAWRFGGAGAVGGVGDRGALLAAYERASGRAVDPTALRYWELFGNLKWAIICQYQAYAHLRGAARSVERAVIGRRVAEVERDVLHLLRGDREEVTCR